MEGDPDILAEAVSKARSMGRKPDECRASFALAEVHLRAGRAEDARAEVRRAAEIAETHGMMGLLAHAEADQSADSGQLPESGLPSPFAFVVFTAHTGYG